MVPEFYLFMLPFLKSLSDGKIHSSDECVEYVCKEMNLSEADRKEPTRNSKRTKVVDRTLWSKTYLQWAGLVNTVNRGHYCITSEGSALLGKGLTIITRDYLVKNYKCFLENSQREKKPKDNKVKSVAEHEDVIYAIQSPNDRIPVEDQVKSLVLSASPSGIKSIVSNLLITLGYYFDGKDLFKLHLILKYFPSRKEVEFFSKHSWKWVLVRVLLYLQGSYKRKKTGGSKWSLSWN